MSGVNVLKHPPYYMIEGYAKLADYDFNSLAISMGMHVRTLQRKINGFSDFKEAESKKLSILLNQTRDALFLTKKV